MTLSHLRVLLERALYADGPTPPHIARLGSTITVKDLARAYLPVYITFAEPPIGSLDFTDPGTVHAVKVALALALDLDPGPMGCAVSWIPELHLFDDDETGESRWGQIGWGIGGIAFVGHEDDLSGDDDILAPTVASEPDAVRALVLAVEHVLEVK